MNSIKNIQIDGIRIFMGQGSIELADGGGSTVELEGIKDIEAAIASLQAARSILHQQQGGEAELVGLAA